MTRYSDNIFSGFQGVTSALSSMSPVALSKTYNFVAAAGTGTTITGVFPPGTQNLTAELFVTQQGSANTSNKLTVSAAGTNLIVIDQFGSATGYAAFSTTSLARFTITASACAIVAPPATGQTNGGEIPFSVTYLKDAGDPSCTCQLVLNFNRIDATWLTGGPFGGAGFP